MRRHARASEARRRRRLTCVALRRSSNTRQTWRTRARENGRKERKRKREKEGKPLTGRIKFRATSFDCWPSEIRTVPERHEMNRFRDEPQNCGSHFASLCSANGNAEFPRARQIISLLVGRISRTQPLCFAV